MTDADMTPVPTALIEQLRDWPNAALWAAPVVAAIVNYLPKVTMVRRIMVKCDVCGTESSNLLTFRWDHVCEAPSG